MHLYHLVKWFIVPLLIVLFYGNFIDDVLILAFIVVLYYTVTWLFFPEAPASMAG